MSTTAGSVAIELRRIADALDKEPDATVEPPMVTFYCNNYLLPDKGKAVFLKTIHLLPKPLSKRPNDNAMELECRTASIWPVSYTHLRRAIAVPSPNRNSREAFTRRLQVF